MHNKDQHRGGDDGCYIHFLSSLGLTNAAPGGIIGVDCEVIVVKILPLLDIVSDDGKADIIIGEGRLISGAITIYLLLTISIVSMIAIILYINKKKK